MFSPSGESNHTVSAVVSCMCMSVCDTVCACLSACVCVREQAPAASTAQRLLATSPLLLRAPLLHLPLDAGEKGEEREDRGKKEEGEARTQIG